MTGLKKAPKYRTSAKAIFTRLLKIGLISFGVFIVLTLIINLWMVLSVQNYIYTDIEELPSRTAILVLGSQIVGTRLSPVLEDRVLMGINLMEQNKGKKILLSGDHGEPYYDEVTAMQLYVLRNAPFIDEKDIFLDYGGFSTWDSVYRARDIFRVKDLVIVTQEFHISRAVIMARRLGIDAIGLSVNQDRFAGTSLRDWQIREYFARLKAFYSIIFQPKPRQLGESFPIEGDGRESWIVNP